VIGVELEQKEWVGWEAVVVMVSDVSVTWLFDGICPNAIITDL